MKRKIKTGFWKDCLTFLDHEQVEHYNQTMEEFQLLLLDDNGQEHEVIGSAISFRWLSENAFYFTFLFDFEGDKHFIKVKKNVKDVENRYIEIFAYDELFINRLRRKVSE